MSVNIRSVFLITYKKLYTIYRSLAHLIQIAAEMDRKGISSHLHSLPHSLRLQPIGVAKETE